LNFFLILYEIEELPKNDFTLDKISTFEFRMKEIDEKIYNTKKSYSQLDLKIEELLMKYFKYLLKIKDLIEKSNSKFKSKTKQFSSDSENNENKLQIIQNALIANENEINEINCYKNKFETVVNNFFGGKFYQGKFDSSLHITWQEHLINSIRELNPNCQLIITTHSPDLCIGQDDKEIDLNKIVKIAK